MAVNDTSVQAIQCNHDAITKTSFKPLLLSKHPGSMSPRGSGYYLLLGLAVGDGVAAGAGVMFQVCSWSFQVFPS